ncbi:TonB-dependent receptor [Paraferrimonas sp. SM1919]|uniref:TonB-dependent receptor n=1 Tax=Paraferrimonas sp. SM1919 TaxID=2662263 RepID=UPI0013D08B3B|nr:TonB-dependent receptor [Paraferrimonas sp. SM1919]
MKSNKFKTSLLTASILLAINVNAQEQEQEQEQQIEVIEVSGYKGSIIKSLNNKRFSDSVVDGISAEDLGKFPDQNVAESLQRITGVTIDRGESGEGQQISVRGFGPDFTNVLFNGRTMPTDNSSRGFSFDLVASELISGANVYKTAKAEDIEGGLGGSVDVTTFKPFDIEGFKAAASAKAVYDDLAKSTNPFVSAIVSNNWDNEFGLLASFAFQQRDSRMDQAWVSGYADNVQIIEENDATSSNTIQGPGVARSYGQRYEEADRQRMGATISAQWAPTDELTLTADVLYSKLTADKRNTNLNRWTSNPAHNATIDPDMGPAGTVTKFSRSTKPWNPDTGMFDLYDGSGQLLPVGQWNSTSMDHVNRDSDTLMIGFNADWSITDDLQMNFDIQKSSSKSDSKNNPILQVAYPIQEEGSFELKDGSFIMETAPGSFKGNKDYYHMNTIMLRDTMTEDDITEGRLDFTYTLELGPLQSVDFGLYYQDRKKDSKRWETPSAVNNAYRFFRFNVPGELLTEFAPEGGFLSEHEVDNGFADSWYVYDPVDIFNHFSSVDATALAQQMYDQAMHNWDQGGFRGDYADTERDLYAAEVAQGEYDSVLSRVEAARALDNGGEFNEFTPVYNAGAAWSVNEETIAAYLQANFQWERVSANLGLRYVQTDNTIVNAGRQFYSLTPQATTGGYTDNYTESDTLKTESSYSKVLPSLNVKFDAAEDVIVRFAYSQTLTRPMIGSLGSGFSDSATASTNNNGSINFYGSRSGGNPNLEPYTATNIELGVEWYYGEDDAINITNFRKDLQDWIAADVGSIELYDHNYEVNRTFEVFGDQNVGEAKVNGYEFAVLHNFDYGFGVQANLTLLDTTAAKDDTDVSKVNMYGLSDKSYNLIGYYENESFGARLAYNWRDSYTLCASCKRGYGESVDAYGQIDASFSYDFNENIGLIAQVINLQGNDPYHYSVDKARMVSLFDTGRRFTFGVRGSF